MRNSRRVSVLVVTALLTAVAGLVGATPAMSAPRDVQAVTSPAGVQVDYYRALFQNKATQLCLESNSAGTIYTRACNSKSTYQQWRFHKTATQRIWNVATGRCIQYVLGSGSATGLVSGKPCSTTDQHQLWKAHITGAEFTYLGQRCLDSNSRGAAYNLQCNGSQNQIWAKVYFSTP
jgi:ricin-type beta-trefoil lectin protein